MSRRSPVRSADSATGGGPSPRPTDWPRALRAFAIIHPVPSAINAALVASLAIIASGSMATAALLAAAMLGFQFSIGALNDLVDADTDRLAKPRKPIPAGLVTRQAAGVIIVLGAAAGLIISATFGVAVLVLGMCGYACGVAYDVAMRARGLGWLCYALAFPLLIAWAWGAAAAGLPPGWPFLLPLAALAGPALHLANSLVDVSSDRSTGQSSLATRLGPGRARRTLAALMATILGIAWISLWSKPSVSTWVIDAVLVATAGITLGVGLSWQDGPRCREAGWLLQASSLSILAVAWLASMGSG